MANTRSLDRWRIFSDGTPRRQEHGGARCKDGCYMPICNAGRANPCCTKRLRVVSWPIPCSLLRHGCSPDLRPDHLRPDHLRPSHLHPGLLRSESPSTSSSLKLVTDWHALPLLEPSPICPSRESIFNTFGAVRWSMWDDPTGTGDCRFALCTSMAPCQVKRLRVASWPVMSAQVRATLPPFFTFNRSHLLPLRSSSHPLPPW